MEARDPMSGIALPLFNPNTQVWRDHFSWSADGLRMIGRTACGRATIEALRLNNHWLIQARSIWGLVGIHPPLE